MKVYLFIIFWFMSLVSVAQSYYQTYMAPISYLGYRNYDFANASSGVFIPLGQFSDEPTGAGFQGFADIGWGLRAGMGFAASERIYVTSRFSYISLPVNLGKLVRYTEEITPEKIIQSTASHWEIASFHLGPSVMYYEGSFFFFFTGRLGINAITSPKIEMEYIGYYKGYIKQGKGVGYGFGYEIESEIGYRFNEILSLSISCGYLSSSASFERVVWEYKNGINQKLEFEEVVTLSHFSANIIFYFDN